MLSIRIVAAGALISLMTVGGAMAQTATGAATGKPIQLLQVLAKPDKTKVKSHAGRTSRLRTASRRTGKRHSVVARERPIHVAGAVKTAAPVTASANISPNPTPAPTPAPAVIAAAESMPQPAPAASQSTLSELVVGGQTVRITSPDDVNEIDRAADAQNAPSAAPAPQAATAAPPAQAIAAAAPAPNAATVAWAHEEKSSVGSASWIAQVLAALGGAVAAGSAAWFLMGSAPQRTYG